MKTIDFWQIIYDERQRTHCYPFARVHVNGYLTPSFENECIKQLVPTSTAEYIAVCSWRLREKRQQGWTPILLRNAELTLERIENNDFDIAILCPFDPEHKVMECAKAWHGEVWADAIHALSEFIHIPDELEGNAIYQNHFIARKEIYQSYVSECLAPAIQFMRDREVFFRPSGYIKKKRDQKEIKETLDKLSAYMGYPMIDWPIGVFVLERLFRIWINDKKYRIINL